MSFKAIVWYNIDQSIYSEEFMMKKRTVVIGAALLVAIALFGSDSDAPITPWSIRSSSNTVTETDKPSPTKIRTIYDAAYMRKRSKGGAGNPEYYLFDFDTNSVVITYQYQYGTHYGKYEVLEDGDLQILENDDTFIDPYRVRLTWNEMYFINKTTGEISWTHKACPLEEAVRWVK